MIRLDGLSKVYPDGTVAVRELTQRARPGAPGSPEQHERLAHTAQAVGLALATGYKLTILDVLRGGARGDGRLRPARWLMILSTAGLAMPSFYVGSLLILVSVAYALWRGGGGGPVASA